ncbi:MAG: ABC transporter permease [archaeon]|nr:ABC transporter permease [archaeon]
MNHREEIEHGRQLPVVEDDFSSDDNHHGTGGLGEGELDIEEQPTINGVAQRLRTSVIGLEACKYPVQLRFEEIVYKVPQVTKTHCGPVGMLCPLMMAKNREWKTILHSLSGEVLPGQMLAIMGPSGAGKTTLLHILSCRQRPSSGTVTVNGAPLTPNQFRTFAAFVPQHDVLIATLTVKETLKFHAELRLPRNSENKMSRALRKERVHNILRQLRLAHVANTLVGDEFIRGISGGERRRLSIAIALLTEPGLIFLDEPTSGLDAAMAFEVMASIRDLAASGRAVIFTIHQPRSNIYHMFDKLLLLCKGRIAYYGDAKTAVGYFAQRGLKCDEFTNPSDFFLDMVVPGESTGQTEEGIERLLSSYAAPPMHPNNGDAVGQAAMMEHVARSKEQRANWFQQFRLLCWRDSYNQLRNPLTLRIKAMQAIMQGLLFGLIFLRLGYNQEAIQSRQGCIIFFVVALIFTVIQGVIQTVPRERNIFFHEREANLYSVSSYLLAKLSTDIPGEAIFNFLFCAIVYYLVGLNPAADRFFIFSLFMVLNSIGAVGIGYWIAVVSPNETVALIITPFVCIFQVLFSGTFLNLADVPDWGIWIPYWSVTRWAFQALIVNEFDGVTFTCEPGQTPCITDGQEVIDRFNFTPNAPTWVCGIVIVAVAVGFMIAAYVTLALKDWHRRRP